MRRTTLVATTAILAVVVLLAPSTSARGDTAKQHEAPAIEFEISTDTNRVVLLVSILTTHTNRAMTVYGDGRLVVTQYGAQRKLVRQKEFSLTPTEIRELVQIAVDHRLAEFDETDIQARQHRARTGEGIDAYFGAGTTRVSIALESYARDGRPAGSINTSFSVYGAKPPAHRYPDIPEFQGVVELQNQLFTYWKKAGWELW